MQGIYKITNKISKHAYIGQSTNIERRVKNHFKAAFSSEILRDKALYVAIRAYGLDNFVVDILEIVEKREDLDAREIYWISYYNTYNYGYNETCGGCGVLGLSGEKHPKHRLTLEDVLDIRKRYAACRESVVQIYKDYSGKVTKSGFKKIYTLLTWKNIMPELISPEVITWHRNNAKTLYSLPGETNPNSKLTNKQVEEIRQRRDLGESVKSIFEDYKFTGITLGGLRNVAGNYSYIRRMKESED